MYLVLSGEEVKRIGALRLTGLATSIACLFCIAQFVVLRPMSALAVAPEVIWLSVLNATLCTFAPVLMVMMAIERVGAAVAAQTGMIGPLSTRAPPRGRVCRHFISRRCRPGALLFRVCKAGRGDLYLQALRHRQVPMPARILVHRPDNSGLLTDFYGQDATGVTQLAAAHWHLGAQPSRGFPLQHI